MARIALLTLGQYLRQQRPAPTVAFEWFEAWHTRIQAKNTIAKFNTLASTLIGGIKSHGLPEGVSGFLKVAPGQILFGRAPVFGYGIAGPGLLGGNGSERATHGSVP